MMLSVGVEDVSAEDFSPRAEGSEVSTGMDAVSMRVGVICPVKVSVKACGCEAMILAPTPTLAQTLT